jgi:hypothetical protein
VFSAPDECLRTAQESPPGDQMGFLSRAGPVRWPPDVLHGGDRRAAALDQHYPGGDQGQCGDKSTDDGGSGDTEGRVQASPAARSRRRCRS